MPRGVYVRKPRPVHPYRIRTLRPGEPFPEGEPRRYPARAGYVRLRWKVGVREYVEVFEHRAVAGHESGQHIHHGNHRKDDNRPENLVPLTPAEHASLHAAERRKFDVEEVWRLYQEGASTVALGKRFGVAASGIWRALRRAGYETRGLGESQWARIDAETVVSMFEAGMRPLAIGKALGVSDTPVRRILADRGYEPHRPGRPDSEPDCGHVDPVFDCDACQRRVPA